LIVAVFSVRGERVARPGTYWVLAFEGVIVKKNLFVENF
jgi:hypothetical protein